MKLMQRAQHGFAAIAAIFLLVVLAALGGFMLTFSNTQQLTSAQDIQGSRAYWAARGGLEWGIAGATAVCPVSPTVLTVDTFSVTVSCASQAYSEGAETVNILRLTSVAATAAAVGSVGYVERSVSATVER